MSTYKILAFSCELNKDSLFIQKASSEILCSKVSSYESLTQAMRSTVKIEITEKVELLDGEVVDFSIEETNKFGVILLIIITIIFL